MRCLLLVVLGLLMPTFLVGCTQKLRGDDELAALLTALDEADATLQSKSDPSAAAAAAEKVMTAHAKFKAMKLTADEWKELRKKYSTRIKRHEKYFE